ncbi:MAG: alkaline phosphatase, partial [Bacteroidales bacterium]|nr:alkaline phosphatase [Bacteroidales bacterium]
MKQILMPAIAAAMLIFAATGCGESGNNNTDSGKAKYIFLFIGDGMGANHVATAESYLSYKEGKLGGEQLVFTGFPYYGTATNFSADKHVTCSAASGTAIACGSKTYNSKLGTDVNGEKLRSMAYDLKDDGYKIGIITTVPVNHATPGAFYANVQNRGEYYSVSCQIPDSGFDFFAGSGFIDYRDKDGNARPVDEYIEEKGYKVCYGPEEFQENRTEYDKIVFCQESN